MYKIILGFKCCPNSLHMKKPRSLLKTMAAPHVWMHWKCMKCRHNCTSSCWCVAAMHVMPCYNDDADDTQNTQSRKLRLVGWGRGEKGRQQCVEQQKKLKA